MQPFAYTAAHKGKDIRGKLIAGLNLWLGVPPQAALLVTQIVADLHAASLMLDDIEDNSDMRRGQPAAHIVYGIPQTMNAANYACSKAYADLAKLRPFCTVKSPSLEDILTDEFLSLMRGQGLDILWRDTHRCPSEEEYLRMINGKASGMLRLGARLMMACATANMDKDYSPLMNLIGIYGQIRDDFMNLYSTEYTETKGFADDISEGKYSFPMIHGIQANVQDPLLPDILKARPSTPTLKRKAIDHLRTTTKSYDYTLVVMQKLEQQTYAEIERLGGNEILEMLMGFLHVDASKLRTSNK
ncbi:isoprenoid synthase domain-containing protein [Schizophyllum amplum]|uniref:(2E,6E)-farnesyl diphosphate synthase n=1 Tax=Schizophyllum amplum TaxID=97359 RepID=A0A550CIJ7_9AGAR|nr:isoprenoid synthase domain-containing protein [Auriculariopsis ampla]